MSGSLGRDLNYGLRGLRKNLVFSLIAIATLALGIGANTAMFSIVDSWLIRPLPLKDPGRLISVWRTDKETPKDPSYFSFYRDYLQWAAQNRSFESLAATFQRRFALTGTGEPEELHGAVATWNMFATLGVNPALGRSFRAEDTAGEATCIISHRLWANRFNSAPEAISRVVTLNNKQYRIIGVLPAEFSYRVLDQAWDTDVWTAIQSNDENYRPDSTAAVAVVGRLQPGVTADLAQSNLSAIELDLDKRYPDNLRDSGILVVGLQQDNTRNLRSSLLLLFCAVAVLLLIACANTASLILGRNAQRQREFAIRVALGCSAKRLLQQLTAESLVLYAIGGVCGLIVADFALSAFQVWNPFGLLPPGGIGLSGRVLMVAALVTLATGLLFGSLPALRVMRVNEGDALRYNSVNSTSAREQVRWRSAFVLAEIAMSLILLICAGLLISTFIKLNSESIGIKTTDVQVMDLSLPYSAYPSRAQQIQFSQRLADRMREIPGVRSTSLALTVPLGDLAHRLFQVEGRNDSAPEAAPRAATFTVAPGYFETLGIPVLQGRTFQVTDKSDQAPVAIIGEETARRFFGDETPIGKHIRLGDPSKPDIANKPWLTVVGVVGNTRSVRYNQMEWLSHPDIYTCFYQDREPTGSVHIWDALNLWVIVQGGPSVNAASLTAALHSVDPNQPVVNIRSLNDIVGEMRVQPRVRAIFLTFFGLLTLVMAAIGIYGVITQSVEQRRREIGLRMALGARPIDVIRLVLFRGLSLTAGGVVIGAVGAFILSRFLQSFLFGVPPFDPLIFLGAISVILTIAMLASCLPALRASRVDPIVTLRYE